jgi:hypothetical protein
MSKSRFVNHRPEPTLGQLLQEHHEEQRQSQELWLEDMRFSPTFITEERPLSEEERLELHDDMFDPFYDFDPYYDFYEEAY